MPSPDQPNLFGDSGTPSPTAVCAPKDVVVREVRCSSLLNRSGINDYSFNCYTGCTHACGYWNETTQEENQNDESSPKSQ